MQESQGGIINVHTSTVSNVALSQRYAYFGHTGHGAENTFVGVGLYLSCSAYKRRQHCLAPVFEAPAKGAPKPLAAVIYGGNGLFYAERTVGTRCAVVAPLVR